MKVLIVYEVKKEKMVEIPDEYEVIFDKSIPEWDDNKMALIDELDDKVRELVEEPYIEYYEYYKM